MYRYEKYICTKETLKDTIDKYGIAVIPEVLNEDECENIVNGIWDFMEHITQEWETPINRNDKNTWRGFSKLYPLHSMLIQYHSIGQAQVSWDVRQNMKIINIFKHIWECSEEELLVSFDGLSFHLPPETTNKGWNRSTWFHTDQSYTNNDFKCIQSYVTGLDVNENDATFSCLEGSNKYHKDFAKEFGITDKADWYKLNKDEQKFYTDKDCEEIRIKCPKGSMVFWDSRTIHCGVEANKCRTEPNTRAIIYVCYMPRKLITPAMLKKKQKAFNELRTTNHYPCKPKLFPKNPRTYGGEIPTITKIDPPVLSDLGKKLAGF